MAVKSRISRAKLLWVPAAFVIVTLIFLVSVLVEEGVLTPRETRLQREEPRTEVEGQQQDANVENTGERGSSKECMGYIVYDKSPKTGSTTIAGALVKHLRQVDNPDTVMHKEPYAMQVGEDICARRRKKEHVIGHLTASCLPRAKPVRPENLVECLVNRGYYAITSIRNPRERWISLYFYIRKSAKYHGRTYNYTLQEFVDRVHQPCGLLSYYDGLEKRCEQSTLTVDQRIRRIVSRYDEVWELDADATGPLDRAMRPLLGRRNTAQREEVEVDLSESTLEAELKLYNAFKSVQSRKPINGRRLCANLFPKAKP